jgi:hypothetical protein
MRTRLVNFIFYFIARVMLAMIAIAVAAFIFDLGKDVSDETNS